MDTNLSEREQQVLQLITEGAQPRDIAKKLQIRESTVRKTTKSVFAKLNVSNREDAALCAIRNDIVQKLVLWTL